ncbi:MAG: NupC/NupG family nucleoside CNT transporter [Rubripirellula sp.]
MRLVLGVFANVSHLNLISLLGIAVMIAMAVLMSSDRRNINWRLVGTGLVLQLLLAAVFFNSQRWTFPQSFSSFQSLANAVDQEDIDSSLVDVRALMDGKYESFDTLREAIEDDTVAIEAFDSAIDEGLKVPRFPNGIVFHWIESFFRVINRSVEAGTGFVFETHPSPDETPGTHPRAILTTFAFGVLPTVIFFAALMSVLYYLGIMQVLIRGMAWVMQKTLGVSGAEALAAAANVLVGHTEAPLVVKPYVATMTRSELNALMVGGFATISGSLMAIFASIGVSAGHLLTASIISAPAALVLAKILQPETETPTDVKSVEAAMEQNAANVLQAAANGASEGMKLAINIAAMLIAFLALIMFIDILLQGIGGWVGLDLSLQRIFGIVFWPLAWIMGIEGKDCMVAGDLLGKKMVINEFVAYLDMIGGGFEPLSERSKVILTYALCGFSNFGAIGIQLGGIGPLAPNRRSDLAQLGLRAMFGGMLACCMTGCVAGALFGIAR